MHIYHLRGWRTQASKYPRTSHGIAAIRDWPLDAGDTYEAYGTHPPNAKRDYAYYRVERNVITTNLTIDGQVWMVDDPPHWWAIQEYAAEFSGHVLVAGLGLGLIVHALAANPKVTSITVVELCKDVIDLVGPLVPKCEIVHSDWYEYEPTAKVDGVFYDLFLGSGKANAMPALREMLELRQRFPGVIHRILGFNNPGLIRLATTIESGIAAVMKLYGHANPDCGEH